MKPFLKTILTFILFVVHSFINLFIKTKKHLEIRPTARAENLDSEDPVAKTKAYEQVLINENSRQWCMLVSRMRKRSSGRTAGRLPFLSRG